MTDFKKRTRGVVTLQQQPDVRMLASERRLLKDGSYWMHVTFYHDSITGEFGAEVNGTRHAADSAFHDSLCARYIEMVDENVRLTRQPIELDKRLEKAKSKAEIAECKLNMIKGVFEESGGW